MSARWSVLVAALAAVVAGPMTASPSAWGQQTPPTPPPAAPADPDAPPYLAQQDKVELTAPPMRFENPGEKGTWIFLDLERLKAIEKEAHHDVAGYDKLKVRLWQPSTKSDIFVHAWPDLVSRAQPLTPEQHGQPLLDGVKAAFQQAEVKGTGATKVGPRDGWLFEVHGKTAADAPIRAVVKAVTYRREDNLIITITLECAADRVGPLKRDLMKVLRKARL